MSRVVVLLGPPGSGKSTVGEELLRRGLRWRDWEAELLQRWGSRERFIEHKSEALPQHHDEILRWVGADGSPAVIETTGLSDASFLDRLERDHECLVVQLEVSERGAVERASRREQGRHLTDDVSLIEPVRRAFDGLVAPTRRVDLVLDTEQLSPIEVADAIVAALMPG